MPAPSAEVRWLRFSVRAPRAGERRYVGGRFYRYEYGDWHPERAAARKVDDARVAEAVSLSGALQKKYDAAPDMSVLVERFGEQGAVRDARGRIVQYNYPKFDDPEKNAKVAREVYELFDGQRRIAEEIGAEESAKHAPVTLVDRRTGREYSTHPKLAAKRARKAGLVEKRKRVKAKERITETDLKRGGSR